MGKNTALAHHTSTYRYFHTRRVYNIAQLTLLSTSNDNYQVYIIFIGIIFNNKKKPFETRYEGES